jgi:hypothetical protein
LRRSLQGACECFQSGGSVASWVLSKICSCGINAFKPPMWLLSTRNSFKTALGWSAIKRASFAEGWWHLAAPIQCHPEVAQFDCSMLLILAPALYSLTSRLSQDFPYTPPSSSNPSRRELRVRLSDMSRFTIPVQQDPFSRSSMGGSGG